MLLSSSLRNWSRPASAACRRTPTSARQRASLRPWLQAFEDRCLPSGLPYPTAATVSQLIADINYADKTGGAFTINLKPKTTFDLTKADNTDNGANGLPVVGGTRAVALTITGNGDTIERVGGFKTNKKGAFKCLPPARRGPGGFADATGCNAARRLGLRLGCGGGRRRHVQPGHVDGRQRQHIVRQ